jgi:membrane protease YdiL (CAAX protease family)
MLGMALLLVRFVARVEFSQLGLYRWRQWSTVEKSYFIQVLVLANGVFLALFVDRLGAAFRATRWPDAIAALFTYLLWGFYQELTYRGILQGELVRRWGTVAGIVVSNVFYTFGPLHVTTTSSPAMFGAIFLIGMFFALLFKRSGNLWMAGIFHGLGDAWITGLGSQ